MPPIESAQFFPEQHRSVFSYHDGTRVRYADPLAVDRRYFEYMASIGVDLNDLAEQAKSKAPLLVIQATEHYRAATRAAFNLPEFNEDDGSGFTGEQVDTLNQRYQEWLEAVKLGSGSSPSSSPSSADPAAPAPSTSTPAPSDPVPAPTPAPTLAEPIDAADSPSVAAGTSNSSASG